METSTFTKIDQRANPLSNDIITEAEEMLAVQLIKERLTGPFLSLAGIKKKIRQDFKKFKTVR